METKNNLETAPNLAETIFFFTENTWICLLHINIVYHVQKSNESKSKKVEKMNLETKNNLETAPNWVQIFFWQLKPRGSARYHYCLTKYAKFQKSNEANLIEWRKTPNLGEFGPILPNYGPNNFFFKNRAPSLFRLRLTWCKKSKKSYDRFPRKSGN